MATRRSSSRATSRATMHQAMAAALDEAFDADPGDPAGRARRQDDGSGRVWPMIVLRSPKGWTGPKAVDGLKTEGSWRAHQVPFTHATSPSICELLEDWMRSYRPEELFDDSRPAAPRNRGAGAGRRAPDERQSARQWRRVDAPAAAARLRALMRCRSSIPARPTPRPRRSWADSCAT